MHQENGKVSPGRSGRTYRELSLCSKLGRMGRVTWYNHLVVDYDRDQSSATPLVQHTLIIPVAHSMNPVARGRLSSHDISLVRDDHVIVYAL